MSTWADEIRPQRRETGRWHYVNIPIHPPAGTPAAYDAQRDCPTGACVVVKIDEFAARLRDRSLDGRARLEALKFVVHFVGDVHQPLHCADDADRSGNDVRVWFRGRAMNLHAVWDTAILAPAVNGDEYGYALRLAHAIAPDQGAAWNNGGATAWASESYDVARATIYGEWPRGGNLPDGYEQEALPVVDERLEKAGVRLAGLLNAALR